AGGDDRGALNLQVLTQLDQHITVYIVDTLFDLLVLLRDRHTRRPVVPLLVQRSSPRRTRSPLRRVPEDRSFNWRRVGEVAVERRVVQVHIGGGGCRAGDRTVVGVDRHPAVCVQPTFDGEVVQIDLQPAGRRTDR